MAAEPVHFVAKSLQDFDLALTGPDAPLLVGGQAVNLWCIWATGQEPIPGLRSYFPLVSKDCDVVGDRELLLKLSQRTSLPHRMHGPREPSPVIGYIYEPPRVNEPLIEVLKSVNGLSSKDIRTGAMHVTLDQKEYYTLSPITLLKAKLANLANLDQEGRQDLKHILMLVPCVRTYIIFVLQEAKIHPGLARDLKRVLRNTLAVIADADAKRLSQEHGLNLVDCFPVNSLKHSTLSAAKNFYEHQLAQNYGDAGDRPF